MGSWFLLLSLYRMYTMELRSGQGGGRAARHLTGRAIRGQAAEPDDVAVEDGYAVKMLCQCWKMSAFTFLHIAHNAGRQKVVKR